MAHLITGYKGSEHIKSADQGSFNAAFFGAGQFVMEIGNQFEGSIINNNTVRILDGDLLMYGRHVRIEPNTYEDLTVTTGTAGKNRIDLVCMTYEKNTSDGTEKAYLQVVKGTETEGTAAEPAYVDGNILNGATKNQMPLYKLQIQGVVLKSITQVFKTIPTYKTLAEQYAAQFEKACNTYLGALNILDTMEEVSANTKANQLAGALALKEAYSTLNSNKENINAFKNYCPTFATTHGNTAIKNALLVNLNSADGSENRIGYVSKSTASIPTDCHAGVREVYYFNKTEVWLKITGIDTNGVLAYWFNRYNGSWSGWRRQSNISIAHKSKTVTLNNGNAMIDLGAQKAGTYIVNATAYYSAVGYVTATVAIQSNRYIRIYQPEQNETLRKASYVCDYYILTVI